tara:strand:- start:355 stop:576 length:222 start_codon:yes stop_codon:yes gene_type:complete
MKTFESAVDRIKREAKNIIAAQPRAGFAHGYLWIELRNGRTFNVSIDGRENWDVIENHVRNQTGVEYTWINID